MTHEQLTVSVAIASRKTAVARTDKVFSELTEEQFLNEMAPGRNRIIYLNWSPHYGGERQPFQRDRSVAINSRLLGRHGI